MNAQVEKAVWDAFANSDVFPPELKGITWPAIQKIAGTGTAPSVATQVNAIKSMAQAAAATAPPDSDVSDLVCYIAGFEIRDNEDGEGFMVFEDMGSDNDLHGPYLERPYACEAMHELQCKGVRSYLSIWSVSRTSPCPKPVDGNNTVGECMKAGWCGCDNGPRLEPGYEPWAATSDQRGDENGG